MWKEYFGENAKIIGVNDMADSSRPFHSNVGFIGFSLRLNNCL